MTAEITLRIAAWNANGLDKHLQELEVFLNNNSIDICLISETHFTRESYFRVKNYVVYHSFHPSNKARGGSAIIIKNNIKHYEETKIQSEMFQVTTAKIFTKNKLLNVAAIYSPPRHSIKEEDYNNLLNQLGNNFILGGDFNAKHTFWGSRIETTKGRALYSAGKQLKCNFYSTGKPTYWPTDTEKIPDLIDFFIVKGISGNYIEIEESFDLNSDHSPIILTLSQDIIKKSDSIKLSNKKTNWENFKSQLEKTIQLQAPLKTPAQLEDELDKLISDIQNAGWDNTPRNSVTPQGFSYPLEIRRVVQEKRKARRKWMQTRMPEHKTTFNKLCKKLSQLIKKTKNESINNYLKDLSAEKESEYSLWRATKYLKRPKQHIPPIKRNDGTWARSNQEKADVFANHLEETFTPLPRQCAFENIKRVSKIDLDHIPLVKFKELQKVITRLSNKKTPGYDLITGEILKELPRKGKLKLLNLINASIRLKYVPMQWKIAEVVMLHKPGKPPHEKSSYRPISLLPIMSKVFEKILLSRLKPIINERNLIPNHQFGFRDKHSTIDQVHRIVHKIENAFETKKICATIFLDVAQAFDKVWHAGLLFKLHRDLPTDYYKILESYLKDRHFRIKYEDEYSSLKKITAGVPQGSVLGPTLYLLYTRDIPHDEDSTIATFADDTAIMVIGKNNKKTTKKLQEAVTAVSIWTKKWRTKLNESKSVHINFTYKKIDPIPIEINSVRVPYANTAKYLGMTLDAKLRWKAHVLIKKEELNIKYRKMYWLLGRHSELSVHNKLLLYKQILKPIWTYGIQLWGCTKKSNIQAIQTVQNKVLRGIVNAPWYVRNSDIHRDLKVDEVTDVIYNFAIKHQDRLHGHENIYMTQLLDNSEESYRRLKRRKFNDLCSDNRKFKDLF